jgi:predicted DNA-binding transcriptional regulator AlpA
MTTANRRNRTMNYLSRTEIAQRIGVKPGALSRYKLPPPDATIGYVRGWLPASIDQWQAQRPGQGARTDLKASPRPS